ncbi:DUF2730 family protein [Aeromonas enteropelogenes]|uniref:DUF2730 family protein n=1 Tax=Aeromonas enteropelogenes TaxID=29489 RepID=UPI003BA0B201
MVNEIPLIFGSVATGLVTGALMARAWLAPRSHVEALDDRVREVETRVEHLPPREEWATMCRDISEMNGSLRSMQAKLEGVDRLVNLIVESKLG